MLLLQVQQCDLVGLVDLNHEDDSVASRVAAYLNDLYARGVAGAPSFALSPHRELNGMMFDSALVDQVRSGLPNSRCCSRERRPRGQNEPLSSIGNAPKRHVRKTFDVLQDRL